MTEEQKQEIIARCADLGISAHFVDGVLCAQTKDVHVSKIHPDIELVLCYSESDLYPEDYDRVYLLIDGKHIKTFENKVPLRSRLEIKSFVRGWWACCALEGEPVIRYSQIVDDSAQETYDGRLRF